MEKVVVSAAAAATVVGAFLTDRHYGAHGRPGLSGPMIFATGIVMTSGFLRRGIPSSQFLLARRWAISTTLSTGMATWANRSFPVFYTKSTAPPVDDQPIPANSSRR